MKAFWLPYVFFAGPKEQTVLKTFSFYVYFEAIKAKPCSCYVFLKLPSATTFSFYVFLEGPKSKHLQFIHGFLANHKEQLQFSRIFGGSRSQQLQQPAVFMFFLIYMFQGSESLWPCHSMLWNPCLFFCFHNMFGHVPSLGGHHLHAWRLFES